MPQLAPILLWNLSLIGIAGLLLWIVSLLRRDASIVDPFWPFGFVLIALQSLVLLPGITPRATLMVCLVSLWGIRLSLHLLARNWRHGEDRRYAAMRAYHGQAFWWRSLFTVFLLQGLLLWFIGLPIPFAMTSMRGDLVPLDLLSTTVWLIGWLFEWIGDSQLRQFLADPAQHGRVLNRGLWRYTRHPNYFGDFCVWWGLYGIAAAGGAWFTFPCPLLMSALLMYVSGVRLTEHTITSRRPEYAAYQRQTNAFFPGPPRP